ncbi:hypothetical protein BCR33DRAFT_780263 [Rhizoclosmatium globosum]|uniref:WD40 repeat-like protein n=1 Tax=Rhizoclosmatium globosum TaxID=329046 RepID=A0A1Y2CW48_9FUNG|nr:hypothetical protein BCR33DRAFT_780263 [Rhizoclosmatium globosum]|eukprot:ORY51241.1 hypothetical protein BCR33DRAFT_780263 [Rhizoclosmatium globosum]
MRIPPTSSPSTSTSAQLLSASFNQDASCIAASFPAPTSGFAIFNVEPFGRFHAVGIPFNLLKLQKQYRAVSILFLPLYWEHPLEYTPISLTTQHPLGTQHRSSSSFASVEMLFATSLVALVGSGTSPQDSPRRLQILNTKRDSVICELSFTSAILSVKLNRKRLVVVLEDHIYLYDIANMKLVHTIDTAPNPNALCALSPSSENCFLAYPPSTTGASAGDLLVFDALNLQAVNIIQAHKSALTCIQFSYDGTLVATASDKGTVIRVFSIPTAKPFPTPPRNLHRPNPLPLLLAMHKIPLRFIRLRNNPHILSPLRPRAPPKRRASLPAAPSSTSNSSEPHSISKYIGSLLTSPLATSTTSTIQSLLPSQLKDPFTPQRDFAFAKIPQTAKGFQNMVALIGGPGVMSLPGPGADDLEGLGGSTVGAPLQLVVVSGNGLVYVFSVDREVGGECVQVKEFSLLEEED